MCCQFVQSLGFTPNMLCWKCMYWANVIRVRTFSVGFRVYKNSPKTVVVQTAASRSVELTTSNFSDIGMLCCTLTHLHTFTHTYTQCMCATTYIYACKHKCMHSNACMRKNNSGTEASVSIIIIIISSELICLCLTSAAVMVITWKRGWSRWRIWWWVWLIETCWWN